MSSKITGTIAARVPNDIKNSIESVLKISDSKMRDVMIDFSRKLESGEISLQNGKIVIHEPIIEKNANTLNLDNFYEACSCKGIKPQDAINKATQMIWME